MKIGEAISENIHRIRKTEHLSIERLAELSGVSSSMLGQIERGNVNPTVSVLGKIATGLHVPLSDLLVNDEASEATVYRALDTISQRLCGGKVIRYQLYPQDSESNSESWETDIFISGVYEPADRIPGMQVYLTVLSGTAEIQAEGNTWRLESRDSVHLHGELPWKCSNEGNTTVRLIETIFYKRS
jgi:transcriptional regulator with XRE-family HTH domain